MNMDDRRWPGSATIVEVEAIVSVVVVLCRRRAVKERR
jgi:hypothetical protein